MKWSRKLPNRLFFSINALELLNEEGALFRKFLVGQNPNVPELFEFKVGDINSFVTAQDGDRIRGILIPDLRNLGIETIDDELLGFLLRRLKMASDIAVGGRLSFDRSWGPHYDGALVSFYIAPIHRPSDRRVLTSIGSSGDLCVWRLVQRGVMDETLEIERNNSDEITKERIEIQDFAKTCKLRAQDKADSPSITTELTSRRATDFTQARTYEEWLPLLSKEQKNFINRDVQHIQRLRGPAGTGKTLTMCLKAIREVNQSISDGGVPKVLFLTHSWALSYVIADQFNALDPVASQFIEVYPLLEVARDELSQNYGEHKYRPVGDDSYEAKNFMQEKMSNLIEDFIASDWITYRSDCSGSFVERLEHIESRHQFVWDVLNEIGSVINGAGLFATKADQRRYVDLERNNWMMELPEAVDRRTIFQLYTSLQKSLEIDGLISFDQELNDFLRYLGSNIWNIARLQDGWDLIFVDEFHLLSNQEREVLPYLVNDRDGYPRILMSTDVTQGNSRSRLAIRPGVLDNESKDSEEFGRISETTLKEVHRYTPEILLIANHLVQTYPEYEIYESLTSNVASGKKPQVVRCGTQSAEYTWVLNEINNSRAESKAILVIDSAQFDFWSRVASNRFLVMKSSADAVTLHRSNTKTLIAKGEDTGGLQFDQVFVVGLTDEIEATNANLYRGNFVRNLYISITRCRKELIIVCNNDFGCPNVIEAAIRYSIAEPIEGPST